MTPPGLGLSLSQTTDVAGSGHGLCTVTVLAVIGSDTTTRRNKAVSRATSLTLSMPGSVNQLVHHSLQPTDVSGIRAIQLTVWSFNDECI